MLTVADESGSESTTIPTALPGSFFFAERLMFVPVACLKCGKAFQVPEAAAGTTVDCPWCKQATAALPVAGIGALAAAAPTPLSAAPLELEDAVPERIAVVPAPRPPRKPIRFKALILVLLASAVCGVGAFFVVGVVRGRIPVPGRSVARIPDAAWADFTPPDGSCTVALPGTPTESDPHAGPGKLYTTRGWFSGTTTWIGWIDLSGEWLQKANAPEAWHLLRPRFDAVKDTQKALWSGTIVGQSTRKYDDPLTVEVEMQLPDGYLVERFVVVTKGPHPRIYYLGITGRGVTPDSPAVQKLFSSLRVDPIEK